MRLLFLFLCIALQCLSSAVDVIDIVHADNTALANRKASGTNCNIKAIVTRQEAVDTPVWQRVRLSVSSAGSSTTLLDRTYGGLSNPPMPGVTINLRFASTHFSEGATIAFTFEAWDMQAGTDPTVSITRSTVVYNKGLTLATEEELYDPPSDNTQNPPVDLPLGYYIPPVQFPNGFAIASQNAMPDARSKLQTMRHTMLNTGNLMNESQLAPYLKEATVFFGFTHGEPTYFRTSAGDQIYFSPLPGELNGYVKTNRTQPAFPEGLNLVVMHSCLVLQLGALAPYSFGTIQSSVPLVPIADRAMASFTAVVWSLDMKNAPLDNHAKLVYAGLSEGKTILEAVDEANKKYNPRNPKRQSLRMVVRGDPYARLVNVYQSEQEWSESRRNSWYWVMN